MAKANLTPETLYLRLRALIAEKPDFAGIGPLTPEQHEWLGRAEVLVELSMDIDDIATFRAALSSMGTLYGGPNIERVITILYRALARAEINAPVAVKSSFIAAGSPFDAMVAVGEVLNTAKKDLLFVDPYADEVLLSDFVAQTAEGVSIRLLAEEGKAKPTLKPAADRWTAQYRAKRPLEVRLTPARQLHDRLIFVDATTVWMLGQSFNALATRAHSSVLRVHEPEAVSLKRAAYDDIWRAASPLVARCRQKIPSGQEPPAEAVRLPEPERGY